MTSCTHDRIAFRRRTPKVGMKTSAVCLLCGRWLGWFYRQPVGAAPGPGTYYQNLDEIGIRPVQILVVCMTCKTESTEDASAGWTVAGGAWWCPRC